MLIVDIKNCIIDILPPPLQQHKCHWKNLQQLRVKNHTYWELDSKLLGTWNLQHCWDAVAEWLSGQRTTCWICKSVTLLKNKENKKTKTKITGPVVLPPRCVSIAHRIRIKFGRAGKLLNVYTNAKCQINWYKIVTWAKDWSFMFYHYNGGRHQHG